MGNCQAVDTSTLVIQHPSGKVERFYWPMCASEVMKTNPGHHVALVLTFCLPPPSTTTEGGDNKHRVENKEKDKQELHNNGVRITRVKVLRPTDTLVLGQAYRLVSSQEVMKGLWARKYAKMKKERDIQSTDKHLRTRPKQQGSSPGETLATKSIDKQVRARQKQQGSSPDETQTGSESISPQLDNPNQLQVAKHERHRSRTSSAPSASTRSRTWRPSLQSISEAAS